jgi:Rab5 GDP/GTP exchange factor
MGAVSFIETMDHTSLSNITQEEFEKFVVCLSYVHIAHFIFSNVEEAIRALPVSEPQSPALPFVQAKAQNLSALSPHAGEESAQLLAISAPAQTLSDDALRLLQKTGDTISKPLNAIGRIFSEALDGAENKLSYLPGPFGPLELGRENRAENRENRAENPPELKPPSTPHSEASRPVQAAPSSALMPQTPYGERVYTPPLQTPYKPRVRRVPSPSFYSSSLNSPGYGREETPSKPGPQTHQSLAKGPSQQLLSQTLLPPRVQSLAGPEESHISRTPTPALDFAGVQAQIDSAHEQAATAARDTLMQIFPTVDPEVIELVLEANDGDLGKSIEGLLEMSSGS